jgi:hypothetical protein
MTATVVNDIPVETMFGVVQALIREVRQNPTPNEKTRIGVNFTYEKGSTGAVYDPPQMATIAMRYTRGTKTWNLDQFTIAGVEQDVDRPAFAERITAAATAPIPTPKDTTA